ncbi:MAG: NTP transferase domain-containing protein [Candidatus Omnitrophica bacterium]|nr:NTP transferase domain-containing protein [Candidatus Omnitrophota bacterium]
MQETVCVILAAGAGKRMRQGQEEKQKVLVEVGNKPMLGHVLDLVASVGIRRVIVVVGFQGEEVTSYLKTWGRHFRIETVKQEKLIGTADAVKRTEVLLRDYRGEVLILYGDTPLLTKPTLERLLTQHRTQKNSCTLLTTRIPDPTGYGRIVYNGQSGSVGKIVEELDTTPQEKVIKEINVGVYCFQSESLFDALKEVQPNNRKGEYYLTDTISILSTHGRAVHSVLSEDRNEVLGVNSQDDLARAQDAFERGQNPTNPSS